MAKQASARGEGSGSGVRLLGFKFLFSYVPLPTTLPQFPHLYNGGKSGIYPVGWLLEEIIFPTDSSG